MKITKEILDGTKVLFADSVPQSIYPPTGGGYWKHMIPEHKIDSALVLGMGGATIPRLLIEKNPDISITAVDNSKRIINYAKKHFNLDELKMKIIIRDAFDFVMHTPERYDYIAVDIWNGRWFPFNVLLPPFITRCKDLLNENGVLYINTPHLDYYAAENLKGGLRDDVGRNIIYRWEKQVDKLIKIV